MHLNQFLKGDFTMNVHTPIILAAALFLVTPALAQEPGTAANATAADANMDILIQKIKADKKLLVASNMDLTDAEAKNFWPLYDAYQKELQKINEHLGHTIKDYADAFNKGPIANDKAKKLLSEALSVQESELKLKRTYADKIGKVLPASKTARYIQIENKIRAVINAELARQIPLAY
jgi:Spy/CpxP family protein refolding chaperone